MNPLICTCLFLGAALLLQLNVWLGWYLRLTFKTYKAQDRFTKVQNLADLYDLDQTTPYVPPGPPPVPAVDYAARHTDG